MVSVLKHFKADRTPTFLVNTTNGKDWSRLQPLCTTNKPPKSTVSIKGRACSSVLEDQLYEAAQQETSGTHSGVLCSLTIYNQICCCFQPPMKSHREAGSFRESVVCSWELAPLKYVKRGQKDLGSGQITDGAMNERRKTRRQSRNQFARRHRGRQKKDGCAQWVCRAQVPSISKAISDGWGASP